MCSQNKKEAEEVTFYSLHSKGKTKVQVSSGLLNEVVYGLFIGVARTLYVRSWRASHACIWRYVQKDRNSDLPVIARHEH